ncbi:MAG: cysteine dioxygenase family protein [Flavobacteriales bacterium]|jgi:hypothetical protein|nr:cysteine dioxygenase family protein [Flavobacteriales bacterium]
MDLPKSLTYIREELISKKIVKPHEVIRIIQSAGVRKEDLEPWADFNHPIKDSYGRKMVYKAPNFEIMVMSWLPGDMSAIHNHGYTTWGAVQVFGENEHATFKIEDNHLKTLTRSQFKNGEIVGVGHHLIHQMGNLTDNNVLTLHVYGVEEAIDNITGDAHLYDPSNGTIQIINGGVFFDLPNTQIEDIIEGPKGDYPTQLRHLLELAKRIRRYNPNSIKLKEIENIIVSKSQVEQLSNFVSSLKDERGHIMNQNQWNILNRELCETKAYLLNNAYLLEEFNKAIQGIITVKCVL